jgi:transglutaminase-like putative cysteine protease
MTSASISEPAAARDEPAVDWASVRTATIEIQQRFSYEYPGPIHDVHQVLMLIPPDKLHGQHLLGQAVDVLPDTSARFSHDQYGNRLCHLFLAQVEATLDISVRVRVSRTANAGYSPARELDTRTFLLPSPLTDPTENLRSVAEDLASDGGDVAAKAMRANAWVHEHLRYEQGVTSIQSTAGDVLDQGAGVCQDFAHLLIAVCRLMGIPARYVSGHLPGEGAMHAWAQALVSHAMDGPQLAWLALDPTSGSIADMPYVTIAVGRDYGDVSPTRGTFRAPYAGRLSQSVKTAAVLDID